LPGGVGSVDAASAVFRWMALRDELNLNRIGVLGYSLGGLIAACLSRRTDQIARLCLLAPMTVDQVTEKQAGETTHEPAGQLLGDLASLTPIEDLVVHDRPTLIMHGAADRIVGPEASLAYRRAVELARHKVEHLLVAQADHLFSGAAARSACLDQLTRFFAPMSESPGDAGRP
ncbi:MAG: alpha/beta hydrolase family protein, partial [Phycisphaerales bacterium]